MKTYKYYYVDEHTRCKTEIQASSVILECGNGEIFRLYERKDEIFLRCDSQLIIKPRSANQVELEDR